MQLATNRSLLLPEVLDDLDHRGGVGGLLERLAELVRTDGGCAGRFDPRACHAHARSSFPLAPMVDAYEAEYRRVLDGQPLVEVRRGDFVREVRGAGTLVPEDIRWIPAAPPAAWSASCSAPAPRSNPTASFSS